MKSFRRMKPKSEHPDEFDGRRLKIERFSMEWCWRKEGKRVKFNGKKTQTNIWIIHQTMNGEEKFLESPEAYEAQRETSLEIPEQAWKKCNIYWDRVLHKLCVWMEISLA